MGQVWTRDDWNNLIDQVNAKLAGIITPLAHAPTQHIWTKQDIQAVRNARHDWVLQCTDVFCSASQMDASHYRRVKCRHCGLCDLQSARR